MVIRRRRRRRLRRAVTRLPPTPSLHWWHPSSHRALCRNCRRLPTRGCWRSSTSSCAATRGAEPALRRRPSTGRADCSDDWASSDWPGSDRWQTTSAVLACCWVRSLPRLHYTCCSFHKHTGQITINCCSLVRPSVTVTFARPAKTAKHIFKHFTTFYWRSNSSAETTIIRKYLDIWCIGSAKREKYSMIYWIVMTFSEL